MSTITNRRLQTALAVLSDLDRGTRPNPLDVDELRRYASDSENFLTTDELACALVQRELDEFRANRCRLRMTATAAG
jgi:hypothetical protein